MPDSCPRCSGNLLNGRTCRECGWIDPSARPALELTPWLPRLRFSEMTAEERAIQAEVNREGVERCKEVLKAAARKQRPGAIPHILAGAAAGIERLSDRALRGFDRSPEAEAERQAILAGKAK